MRLLISILLIFSAFNINVNAEERREGRLSGLTFGLEWGYVATLHSFIHYNFFAPEGYRVDHPKNSFEYRSNAEMYVHAGYNLNSRWNISLYLGYEGISDFHKAVPVSLRMTRYFNPDSSRDRWFSFIDLGSGICLKSPPQEILTGKLGGGYRLALDRRSALDFMVSARMIHTHPQVIYDNAVIQHNRINRNSAFVSAISIGMALTF